MEIKQTRSTQVRRISIPLPNPKALEKKVEKRPLPWALIKFLLSVTALVLGFWLLVSFGYLDHYAPQIERIWSILVNNGETSHSENQRVFTCPMHPEILSNAPGDDCPICGMDLVEAEKKPPQDITFACPMHPEILRDKPDDCPICGMDLVPLEVEEHSHEDRSAAMESAGVDSETNEVTIDPQMANNLGVRTESVQTRTLSREVRFTGEVAVNDSSTEVLQSWVAGRVQEVYVTAVGDKVAKGDPIARVYSPQLLTSSEELLSALQYVDELRERDALPQSILDAQAMVDATEKRLRLWGLQPKQLERLKETRQAQTEVMVYASTAGTVQKKLVYDGQYVKEGTPLYQLIDLDEIWVYLNIFENELGHVYQGMSVEFSTPAFQGRTFYGTVSQIEPIMDSESRTGRVRVAVSNQEGRLIPGMYVESKMEVPISSGRPTVSNLAVIRTGERDLVMVVRGEGRFYPQEVTLGPPCDGYYPILSGLEVGQEVVSQASFLLDSESQLKAALQQMRQEGGHNH